MPEPRDRLREIFVGEVEQPRPRGVRRGGWVALALRDRMAELEDVAGLGAVGVEVGLADRPAGERVPGVRLEVIGVEAAAHAGPVVRGAAEVAQPGDVERVVVEPDVLAGVDVLALGADLKPAGFHQRDRSPGRRQAARQSDPGRAGADHADIEALGEGRAVGARGVDDHPSRP